jgi:predicted DCC family thiol-disulfide oxidoreductase YuxK
MSIRTPRFVIAYDSKCGPCSTFKAVVDLLDPRDRFAFVPLEVADASGLLRKVAPPSRYASFHLLDLGRGSDATRVHSGADALLPLLGLLSPSRAAARVVEGAPLGSRVASFAYSALSRLHRSCQTG